MYFKTVLAHLNRSFFATLIARINITPCVLTRGNSSLNTKFESLESKLCREITTIKSYFIDKLRPLKNETTITKSGTAISILLELKNKFSKDDVTNKQKFIDTILQHNSKLSQNFDVSSIIPATANAKKQPLERQHYEKKDNKLNNPQKQDKNKSSEKSNEKNGSNKGKK